MCPALRHPGAGARRSPVSGTLQAHGYATRLAVRERGRIAIVPVASITRIEAHDNEVLLFAAGPRRHRVPLARLLARLDPAQFVRIHRSHAVNVAAVREIHPLWHGEFRLVLDDGTSLRSGRTRAAEVIRAFELAGNRDQPSRVAPAR